MHAIVTAEISYRATHSNYSTLSALDDSGLAYIDPELASGRKQGYNFTANNITSGGFYIFAQSLSNVGHVFYVDEAGVICLAPQGTADPGHLLGNCSAGGSSWSQVE